MRFGWRAGCPALLERGQGLDSNPQLLPATERRRSVQRSQLAATNPPTHFVLPDPIAAKYLTPAKRFAWLKAQCRERYKDTSMSFGKAGEKIRRLINEHLIGLGVNPKVPPVDLM